MKTLRRGLIPVVLCFFAMGFVDSVGIASNYIKADLSLSDTQASLFLSLAFIWFLLFSVPTGILMNHIGRRKTVLISLILTIVALPLPLFGNSYGIMLTTFSLLGIGNTLMQVSLNPLLSTLVRGNKVASSLTFGQFIKAISSFLAPYLIMWGAVGTLPSFGLGWRVLFLVYLIIGALIFLWLAFTPIEEEKTDVASGFKDCFSLLRKPFIALSFIGVVCLVGLDVGISSAAPKILMERLGFTLDEAGFATSLYFLFRIGGCLLGAFLLQRIAAKVFFLISIAMILIALTGLLYTTSETLLYTCIALIGLGNANIFPIIFSQAITILPQKKNEISGLMITAVFGGALFPLLMGIASDQIGQIGAVAVMIMGALYLLLYSSRLRSN